MNAWEERYVKGDTPWDHGQPSRQLARVLDEHGIAPGRALDVGCGTGVNAIWLAQRGFEVTGCDLSPTAIERARARAAEVGANVRFLVADLLAGPDLGAGHDLVFDRGVWHVLRREGATPYLELVHRALAPSGRFVVLAGNANDPSDAPGPPRVHAHELCAELQPWFALVELREFTWQGVVVEGRAVRPLGWAGVFRRRSL